MSRPATAFLRDDGSIDPDLIVDASADEWQAIANHSRQRLGIVHIGQETERKSSFKDHLVSQGLAEKTVAVYARQINRALIWFAQQGADLAHATGPDLAEFAKQIPFTHGSRRQVRAGLQHYYNWIGRQQPPLKAIQVPTKPRYLSRALSAKDASRLRQAAEEWHPQGTVVLAGLYLALRASEIAAMRWDRFSEDLEWYTVMGKGSYSASIPVHPVFREHLARHKSAYLWLFAGSAGRPHVSYGTILGWVTEVSAKAGIKPVKPHQLRHTALAHANDVLGDLRAVAEFARHRRVETTMGYTRTTNARLEQVVAALDY